MGYGQVNVGSSKTEQVISLINFDLPSNTNSVKSSNSIRVNTTNTIHYNLFAHSFGTSFPCSITLQGSNDNNTWTDINNISSSGNTPVTLNSSTSGYSYYRLTSICKGDTYSNRTQCFGCLSTSEIIN